MAYIQQKKLKIIEGQLRCAELSLYLEKIRAPKSVWISEDASGIVQKVIYDVNTNQLVGLTLPIDEANGMPRLYQFIARTLKDIESHMKKELSHFIYAIVAQPLKPNSPPFILQIYGTNNKFTADQLTARWKYTINELKRFKIISLIVEIISLLNNSY